jgi:hypothetical protein
MTNRERAQLVWTVPCAECGAKEGEPCRASNGRVWKSGTHYIRRDSYYSKARKERRAHAGECDNFDTCGNVAVFAIAVRSSGHKGLRDLASLCELCAETIHILNGKVATK